MSNLGVNECKEIGNFENTWKYKDWILFRLHVENQDYGIETAVSLGEFHVT